MQSTPIVRRGARVAIRHPSPDDAEEFIALNRASAALHYPWVTPPTTPEQFVAYLERSRREDTACFLVYRNTDSRILGAVNLSQIFYGNFQNAYMGYYIGAPFASHGYMTEAVPLVLDHAFGPLQLHRIEANIQPDNQASIALVRRLGFTLEGFSRRYLRIDGEWRDHQRWAILAEDWSRLHALE